MSVQVPGVQVGKERRILPSVESSDARGGGRGMMVKVKKIE
jgi:hypothetical protein